ncbi:MAG: DUF3810 family protein [Planctomycetes bacterium]|nr:DUF3810 family protein [Planctomycetota bacterium]
MLWTLCPPPAGVVDAVYSRTVYRLLAAVLVPVGDLVPFSLSLLALLLFTLLLPGLLLWRALRLWREKADRAVRTWCAFAARTAIVWVVVGYSGFLLLWGGNYQRLPIEETLALGDEPVEAADLEALAEDFVTVLETEALAPQKPDVDGALLAVRDSLARRIDQWYGAAPRIPRRVKTLPRGWLLTFGTSGVTLIPFLEAHVDGALPDPLLVAVAAHELAHSAGLARESDAELAGLLAAWTSGNAFARYAAALIGYSRCCWQLSSEVTRRLTPRVPDRAKEDLAAMVRITQTYRIPSLSRLQSKVYDIYLRSQKVEDGIRNYSKAVTLLARARRRGLLDGGGPPGE